MQSFALTTKLVREASGPWFEAAAVTMTNAAPRHVGSTFFVHNQRGAAHRLSPSRHAQATTAAGLEGELFAAAVCEGRAEAAEAADVVAGTLFTQWRTFRVGRLPTMRAGLAAAVRSSGRTGRKAEDSSGSDFATVSQDEHFMLAMATDQALLEWSGLTQCRRQRTRASIGGAAEVGEEKGGEEQQKLAAARRRGSLGVRAAWMAAVLTMVEPDAMRQYRKQLSDRSRTLEHEALRLGHYAGSRSGHVKYVGGGRLGPMDPDSDRRGEQVAKQLEQAAREGTHTTEMERYMRERRSGVRESLFSTMDASAEAQTEASAEKKGKKEWVATVSVANVGNSRAFAVHVTPRSGGGGSSGEIYTDGAKMYSRDDFGVQSGGGGDRTMAFAEEKVTPLSVDAVVNSPIEHARIIAAGGRVENNRIDGDPQLDCAREFGRFQYKDDSRRPPVEQKIIASPDVLELTLRCGDYVVLASHSLFEARSFAPTSFRDIYRVVRDLHDRGASVADVACALCDLSVQCGSVSPLNVTVMQLRDPDEQLRRALAARPAAPDRQDSAAADAAWVQEWLSGDGAVCRSQHVRPGPIYVTMIRNSEEYRARFERDIARCGTTVVDVLRARYQILTEQKALFDAMRREILPHYPQHLGWLMQLYNDEADLLLRRAPPVRPEPGADEEALFRWRREEQEHFEVLAKLLLKPHKVENARMMSGLARSGGSAGQF